MKRGGPLKRSEKPMAKGGLPAATKAQELLFRKLSDQIGCVVCLFFCRHPDGSRVEGSITQIHHLLSGTVRISHWHVIPLCKMHHDEGRPGNPSFHSIMGKYGKAEFEETYATEMELVMMCEDWINQHYVTGLLTDDEAPQDDTAALSDYRDTDTDADSDGDHIDVQEKPIPLLPLQTFGKRVRVTVMHHRVRKADPDNLNAKGALDGFVKAGLLQDDSAKYVEGIYHEQVNVKTYAEEKTVFTLEEVDAA